MLTADLGNYTMSHSGWGVLPQLFLQGHWFALWKELRFAPTRSWKVIDPFVRYIVYPLLPSKIWRLKVAYHHGIQPVWHSYSAIRSRFAARHNAAARATEFGFNISWQPYLSPKRGRIEALTNDAAHDVGDFVGARRAIFGIDQRDPTGDRRLVQFCMGVPEAQFMRDGQIRWLVRRFMGDGLPTEVTNNRQRGCQSADLSARMVRNAERIAQDVRSFSENLLLSEAIDLHRIRNIVEEAAAGSRAASARGVEGIVPRCISAGHFVLQLQSARSHASISHEVSAPAGLRL